MYRSYLPHEMDNKALVSQQNGNRGSYQESVFRKEREVGDGHKQFIGGISRESTNPSQLVETALRRVPGAHQFTIRQDVRGPNTRQIILPKTIYQ